MPAQWTDCDTSDTLDSWRNFKFNKRFFFSHNCPFDWKVLENNVIDQQNGSEELFSMCVGVYVLLRRGRQTLRVFHSRHFYVIAGCQQLWQQKGEEEHLTRNEFTPTHDTERTTTTTTTRASTRSCHSFSLTKIQREKKQDDFLSPPTICCCYFFVSSFFWTSSVWVS